MQIIADVTNRRIEAVHNPQEAGAVGVALVAAVGLGIYPDFSSLKKVVKVEKVFEPNPQNLEIYDSLFQAYKDVYRDLRHFYTRLNKQRIETCM
jgi:xylulokinase